MNLNDPYYFEKEIKYQSMQKSDSARDDTRCKGTRLFNVHIL